MPVTRQLSPGANPSCRSRTSASSTALGTATAPIYLAHTAGIPIHVWVSETRPRQQGARLTAWELVRDGIDTTVITDNMAGSMMRLGHVNLVVVGADRIADDERVWLDRNEAAQFLG